MKRRKGKRSKQSKGNTLHEAVRFANKRLSLVAGIALTALIILILLLAGHSQDALSVLKTEASWFLSEANLTYSDTKVTTPQKVVVTKIVDGDTVHLAFEDTLSPPIKARLIGMDTPETDELPLEARLATHKLRDELSHGDLWITYDEEPYDRYDRDLVYIWTKNPKDLSHDEALQYLVNYRMVQDGYAEVLTIEPNSTYSLELEIAEKFAYANKRGLWAYGDFSKKQRYSLSYPKNSQ